MLNRIKPMTGPSQHGSKSTGHENGGQVAIGPRSGSCGVCSRRNSCCCCTDVGSLYPATALPLALDLAASAALWPGTPGIWPVGFKKSGSIMANISNPLLTVTAVGPVFPTQTRVMFFAGLVSATVVKPEVEPSCPSGNWIILA